MEDIMSKSKKRDKDAISELHAVIAAPGFCALMVVLGVYFSK
jgi:hypothetical protein